MQILSFLSFVSFIRSSTCLSLSRRDSIVAIASGILMSKTSRPPIRWGIVGLGDVTRQKSGPPFWKCQGSELVAVMRRTPGKAQEFARQVPGCVGYDDLESFLQHPGLDAVYVATRPGTHLEICKAAAGKFVYVEKPVGRSSAETAGIIEAVGSDKLYTAYISRAYPRTEVVRKLLREGVIGESITSVSYTLRGSGGARDIDSPTPWRFDVAQSGGGLIMDVGCHVLDRIDWLCGPIEHVNGTAKRNQPGTGVEDYVRIEGLLGRADWTVLPPAPKARVQCEWDFASDEEMDEFIIRGPSGGLKMVAMSATEPIYVLNESGETIRVVEGFEQPEHTAQAMIQAVTDDLRGIRKAPFLSRGENALRTSRVLDKALGGFYGKRDSSFWDSTDSWLAMELNTE